MTDPWQRFEEHVREKIFVEPISGMRAPQYIPDGKARRAKSRALMILAHTLVKLCSKWASDHPYSLEKGPK